MLYRVRMLEVLEPVVEGNIGRLRHHRYVPAVQVVLVSTVTSTWVLEYTLLRVGMKVGGGRRRLGRRRGWQAAGVGTRRQTHSPTTKVDTTASAALMAGRSGRSPASSHYNPRNSEHWTVAGHHAVPGMVWGSSFRGGSIVLY